MTILGLARRLANLNRDEVARLSDVSAGAVSMAERGRYRLRPEAERAVALVLVGALDPEVDAVTLRCASLDDLREALRVLVVRAHAEQAAAVAAGI